MAKKSITITLPDTLVAALDESARAKGLNRSQYVENLVKQARNESDVDEGFVKSVEMRGSRAEVFGLLKWYIEGGDGSLQHSGPDSRPMIIRTYVRPTEEERALNLPPEGMTFEAEGFDERK